MVVTLLFIGSFLAMCFPVISLSCIPCSWVQCSTPVNCKGGLVKSICGCCNVCAKVEGEKCGGWWQIKGRCDFGLKCVVTDGHLLSTEGICVPVGSWSSWSGWTSCSQSCGSGSQERSRICTPAHDGRRSCAGAALQTQKCNKQACPVDGGWSGWNVWSSCSNPCDVGTQGRSRSCTNPRPRNGGKPCPGVANEQRVCNTHSCPVDGAWSSWSMAKPCSVSCGKGVEMLSRSCTNPVPKHGGKSCSGNAQKQQACTKKPCPIDGGWSRWSVSKPCSVTCGSGIEILSRTCTNPAPKHGGRSCPGVGRKEQACKKNPCPIDGSWSSWFVSTPCSVTCGTGVEILSRSCTNPAPKYGGKSCQGDAQKQEACTKKPCPIHGEWSSWSVAKPCSVSCGSGVEILSRSCTNPAPEHGGKSCTGEAQKQQACTKNPCPIDGGWSRWSDWKSCSKSCGTGVQEHFRSCTQPEPSYGGKPCDGEARESRWCNKNSCPIDGGWSSWNTWTPCSKSCGTGFHERSRSCTQPASKHGGKACHGDPRESRECNVNSCPVHGGWSKWSNWTECSVTCGAGVMSRERHCDNPAPAYGGNPCEGGHRHTKSCVTGEVCIVGKGCYGNYPSVLLGSYTDEIDWFARFASQMETIIKKCAELAVKKRYRYFAVEGYGNCYGAQNSPSGGGPKATQCNFGVGLDNHYYVYEISL